jgi:hypothetical protein
VKEIKKLKDLGIDVSVISKMEPKGMECRGAWPRLIWLRIIPSSGLHSTL